VSGTVDESPAVARRVLGGADMTDVVRINATLDRSLLERSITMRDATRKIVRPPSVNCFASPSGS
jgi:hypothetical protein